MRMNIKVAYKLFATLSPPKFYKLIVSSLVSMMKHSQTTQIKKFENICNISKKLEMELIFCMQITSKFLKVNIVVFGGND